MSDSTHQDGIGDPDSLDRLWTPHRMAYIRGESKPVDDSEGECPFCRIPSLEDSTGLVVRRGESAFVVLNLYPYAPGHLMVCPYRHIADYTHRTWFKEVVPGIPVMFEWELRNVFRNGSPPFVQTGKVFDIRWTDSTRAMIDTVRQFH